VAKVVVAQMYPTRRMPIFQCHFHAASGSDAAAAAFCSASCLKVANN
jgi:hypothetical protein